MEEKFNKQIIVCEKSLHRYSSIFSLLGYFKLAAAAFLIASVYFTFAKGFNINYFIVDVILLLISIFLWYYHAKIHEKVRYYTGIIEINKRCLDRIAGEWPNFPDIGKEFLDTEHPYACDLDIVGKNSLFQLLNVTNTWHGRQAFSKDLLAPVYDRQELALRHQAIQELSMDIEFCNRMQYFTSKIGVNDSILKLIKELDDKKGYIKSKFIKYFLRLLPIFTIVFVFAMIAFQLKNLYLTGTALIFLQSILWLSGLAKTNAYLGAVDKMPCKLENYSVALEMLESHGFESEKLKGIKSQLTSSSLSATAAIKELDKISNKINIKHDGIIYIILNVLLLWDYDCAFMLKDWKEKYAGLAEGWFLTLGEFESLLSFSLLPNICSNVCIPVITEESKVIEAIELGHPLITNSARVNNTLTADGNIFIISGSNMSGKTTFLRTAGINLVLVNAGSLVCAKRMTASLFTIRTSMRIADDLSEGISTFYAEIKKIKGIIDTAKINKNMIFLIDEIFRGTNSLDRFYGAQAVIEKLGSLGVMGIITTHDLELCELANQNNRIRNLSFSEYYKGNQMYFNYKVREGKSNTTNAKFLMEMVGIL